MLDGHRLVAYPIVHKVACFGFVVEEPEKPGQLDAKRAASLGTCMRALKSLAACDTNA
jgi:hypothetical protein